MSAPYFAAAAMMAGNSKIPMQPPSLSAYEAAAPLMKPGDVIAFMGRSFPVSNLIEAYTGCKVSHVGLVQSALLTEIVQSPTSPQYIRGKVIRDVMLFESTIYTDPLTGKKISGPQTHPLGQVLNIDYAAKGSCAWLLRLRDNERALIDFDKFNAYIAACEIPGRVTYDIPGLLAYFARAIPFVGSHIAQTETYRRMFCSAADCAVFQNSGLNLHRDYTATSPADLIRMQLYIDPPIQILGPPTVMDAQFNAF